MIVLLFCIVNVADSDRANNNSLIAHITNLPGFDASKARFVKHYSSTKRKKTSLNPESKSNESSSSNYYLEDDEIRVDRTDDDGDKDGGIDGDGDSNCDDGNDNETNGNNDHSVNVNAIIIVTSSGDEDVSPPCPTAAELTLPWRRDLSKHSFGKRIN